MSAITVYLFNVFLIMCKIQPFVCVGYVHVHTGTHGSQKRALNPLKLELQAVVRPLNIGVWNLISVLCESSTCSKPQSYLPAITVF